MTARRPLDRKPCPRCGRTVAWRVIRGPRVNRGRYRAIPAITQPVRHMHTIRWDGLVEVKAWCEPQRGPQ